MPQRSTIDTIPVEAREQLNQLLIEKSFANYDELTDSVNLLLQEYELEVKISRSALHRYGRSFQQKCEALKMATEQAKAMVEASPDNEGDMAEALQRLMQERLFNVAMDLDGDVDPKTLSAIARAISDVNRTSVATKKYAAEVKDKVAAKFEALKAESSQGSKRNIDPETLRIIREEVYGLV